MGRAVYNIVRLARGSRLRSKRVKRGLWLLRQWMMHEKEFFELQPRRIAKDLGLGHSGAIDIGYALRYWERMGFVIRENHRAARYTPLPRLYLIFENHGCHARLSCIDASCGLVGTRMCPFLEGIDGVG